MLVDFHTHTTVSDGRMTPQELMAAAHRNGLSVIAITDHDALDGCRDLADPPGGLRVVPGIELSVDDAFSEVHLLGLGIDIEDAQLKETVRILRVDRVNRIEKMVDKLNHLGYDLSVDDIFQNVQAVQSAGRPHVAQALVTKGYFPSVKMAFDKLLHHNGPAYVPHFKLSLSEAVGAIHTAGGLAIVAHPGLIAAEASLRAALASGVDGIEVFHPQHSLAQISQFSALAREKRWLVSGGSDFHAIPGRYPLKPGVFAIPAECVKSLLERLALLK